MGRKPLEGHYPAWISSRIDGVVTALLDISDAMLKELRFRPKPLRYATGNYLPHDETILRESVFALEADRRQHKGEVPLSLGIWLGKSPGGLSAFAANAEICAIATPIVEAYARHYHGGASLRWLDAAGFVPILAPMQRVRIVEAKRRRAIEGRSAPMSAPSSIADLWFRN